MEFRRVLFRSNAGGVIVSYFEWVQGLQAFLWSEMEVTDKLFRILEHSFAQVIKRAKEHKISHRTAAMAIGVERVIKAKQVRGLFPRTQISRYAFSAKGAVYSASAWGSAPGKVEHKKPQR